MSAYNMDLDDVLRITEEMRAAPGSAAHKTRVFGKSHPDFLRNYPVLFEMACKPQINMDILRYMISTLQTQGEGQDTEVLIGQKLVDTYVKPVVPKP
jgi:hypothetical protein